jgi:hypothetical protein
LLVISEWAWTVGLIIKIMLDHSLLTSIEPDVVQFQVVTSSGKIQIVNEASNPDLFWALRGGGGE